jgi:hypothetical protein
VEHAANVTGASARSVARAKRVQKAAPDLYREVVAGTLDLKGAESRVKRRLWGEKEAEARRTTFDAMTADAEGPKWKMLHGDFRDRLADLGDGSVDCVLTDAPYNGESVEMFSDLAKHAARLLRRQGLLIVLSGGLHHAEVLARLTEHLDYGWMYCQPLPGQHSKVGGRHVYVTWKAWLVLSNGPWPSGAHRMA